MNILKLSDGREIPVTFCGAALGYLQIRLAEKTTVAEAAVLFDNPDAVRSLTFLYGDNQHAEYEGYTELQSVRIDPQDGACEVQLRRYSQ